MKKKHIRFVAVVAVSVIVDQATKLWIHENFFLYQSVEIIQGVFSFTYLLNSGSAFGFLSNIKSSWIVPFFLTVGIAALTVILYLYREFEEDDLLPQYAFSFIFGGALGNLIDRAIRGEVIDFLDVYWGQYHWPAFNVADSSITLGVFLFILYQIREGCRGTGRE